MFNTSVSMAREQGIISGDALKKVNISLDKLIAIVMSNGLSPLCGIADPSRAYS